MQATIVTSYLSSAGTIIPTSGMVNFYLAARALSASLSDSAGQKPSFNLRSLVRAVQYAAFAAPMQGLLRSLYDGCLMCFVTMLDAESTVRMEALIKLHVLAGSKLPPVPKLFSALANGTGRMLNIEVRSLASVPATFPSVVLEQLLCKVMQGQQMNLSVGVDHPQHVYLLT